MNLGRVRSEIDITKSSPRRRGPIGNMFAAFNASEPVGPTPKMQRQDIFPRLRL